MNIPLIPPLMENELNCTVMEDSRHGVPLFLIKGAFGGESWPALAEACARESGKVRLLDFSGISHCQTTADDAASFGRQLARQSVAKADRPCHVFVAPGDLLFGLCRVAQMNLDMAGLSAAVFRTTTSALHWLQQENLIPVRPMA